MSEREVFFWCGIPIEPQEPPYEPCRFCAAEPTALAGGIVGASYSHADDCYGRWMTSGPKPIWLAWQAAGCPEGWDPQVGPPW